MPLLPASRFTPLQLIIALLVLILLIDTGVMYVLENLLSIRLSFWSEIGINAAFLALGCAPFLWFLVLRPLQQAYNSEAIRAQVIMDTAGEGIVTTDEHGIVLSFNRAAEKIFAYRAEEIIGQSLGQLMPAPQRKAHDGYLHAYLRGEGAKVIGKKRLMTGQRQDGSQFPLEISISEIRFGGKRMFAGIIHDVSDFKAAEAALFESQESQLALLNATIESAMLVSTNGDILSLNQPAATHFKQTQEHLIGKNIFDLWPPEVSRNRREHVTQATHHNQVIHFQDRCFGRIMEMACYPVRSVSGAVDRIAIYSNDVTEQTRLRGVETLLREVDERTLAGAPLAELATYICARVVELFGLALAWIGEKTPDGTVTHIAGAGPATGYQEELRQVGIRWDETATGRGTTGSAIRLGKIQVLNVTDAVFGPWHEAAQRHHLAAICAIPLIVRGNIYGAATMYSESPETFRDPALLQQLENIAARISVALEKQLDQNRLRLLSAALATASNAVFITDRHGRIEWVNEAFSLLSGYAASEVIGQTPRFLKSGVHDANYYQALWQAILAGKTWRSQTTEKRKDGSLYTVRQVITPIANDNNEITHFISMHEDITEQIAAQAHVEYMAHYDALTDLPNRNLFFDRLSQAIAMSKRSSEHIALLFLDLDTFKPVNDAFGHVVGDQLLKAVAERLQACVRESDTVARIAGDEFTVTLLQIADRVSVIHIAEKIVKSLSEPFLLGSHQIQIGVSIGIALYPENSQNEQELVKLADDAMYAAKKQGRNTYCFYSPA